MRLHHVQKQHRPKGYQIKTSWDPVAPTDWGRVRDKGLLRAPGQVFLDDPQATFCSALVILLNEANSSRERPSVNCCMGVPRDERLGEKLVRKKQNCWRSLNCCIQILWELRQIPSIYKVNVLAPAHDSSPIPSLPL